MTKPRIVQFACPAALVDRIDQIAQDEMLPRARVRQPMPHNQED